MHRLTHLICLIAAGLLLFGIAPRVASVAHGEEAERRPLIVEDFEIVAPRQLGPPIPGPEAGKTQLVPGLEQLFVITPNGALYGMGVNWYGQLGRRDLMLRDLQLIVPEGVRQVVGAEHTLIVKRDGSLWGMGRNHWGQLGLGVVEPLERWADKNAAEKRAGQLRPRLIVEKGVVKAAASLSTSMFLKEDGSLWAMGSNSSGQLGVGNPAGTPGANQPHLKKSWYIEGRDEKTPTMVEEGGVVDVAICRDVGYYIKEDGSLWATGLRWKRGERWDPANEGIGPIKVADGPIRKAIGFQPHLFFLREDGTLWGVSGVQRDDEASRPEPALVAENVVDFDFSMSHSLSYLDKEGRVWRCRRTGDFFKNPELLLVSKMPVEDVESISVSTTLLMVTDENELYGEGSDTSGQLTGVKPGPRNYGGRYMKEPMKPTDDKVKAAFNNSVASFWVTLDGQLMTLGWYPRRNMTTAVYYTGKQVQAFPDDTKWPGHDEPRALTLPAKAEAPTVADDSAAADQRK